MWCQANKAVTGNQETFWTNMARASIRGLMQHSVTLWRHWHYDVTSWHAQTVRQNATVGEATPPAPETIQMISRKLLQSLQPRHRERRHSNIQPSVEGVRCEGAPLTQGDKLWQCDIITGHWHLVTSLRIQMRGLVISTMQIADYTSQRLSRVTKLSQSLRFEACCIKHLFVYRFNDWLLTEFPLFCAFLKTSHKLLSADSQYNGCVCTNSNWG